ncbi:transferase, Chloramphenicol acetyltransferase-like domain protein [Artemisia annua]|uniref:Transferase, Chloramphenicol acetyltransferase-like domain protein n=1 Tax=Artemisia annua TaxID=35608 RepID=A0A2U1LI37_ARTAN|nr:transferase, Chloramphenicol acetyltransferase-like domain protein [Artemisia annua]
MASLPIMTILEGSQVSPPPATVGDTSLPLTFFDIMFLLRPPIHFLLFYELPLNKTHFTQTIVPNIKHSLSLTLQHFFPYAGNLIVYPARTQNPKICYVQGDSVNVTFAECSLDFSDLTGYHPRNCDKFYHLIPLLGHCARISDYVKIPVFSLQVTLFPSHVVQSFLANGTLPLYKRVIKYPELDEKILKLVKVESLNEIDYQPPKLLGPTDKVRATFVLTRTFINQLKTWISTQLPTLPHVSSVTVACAYIWRCIAKSRNDELQLFAIPIDCRTRMDPPIPAAYFGNCISACTVIAKTTALTGKYGLVTAAKLIGANLHKMLAHDVGIMKEKHPIEDLFSKTMPKTIISISGTPKFKFYDMDFGWGKPKKLEKISLDYGANISIEAGRKDHQDLEIGVCLTATQMQVFVHVFNRGLEPFI